MVYKSLKFLLFLFVTNISFGQVDNMLFLMDNVPSSRNVNIAAYNDSTKFHFAFPIISGIQASLNSDFKYDDIIKIRPTDGSKFLDPNSFIGSLRKRSHIQINAKINLLRFGFRFKDGYVNFSVDENINADLGIDRGVFQFLIYGNKTYENNQGIGSLTSNFSHTREFSISYAKKVEIKNQIFDVGIKPKIYFGLGNFESTNTINYRNDQNFSSIGFDLRGSGNISAPIDIVSGQKIDLNEFEITSNLESSYISNSKNKGFGFDIGASYEYDLGRKIYNIRRNNDVVFDRARKVKVDFSIVDIGRINWKSNSKSINYNLSYQFNGFDLTNHIDSISEGYDFYENFIQNELDSLELDNSLSIEDQEKYSTGLKPKFYLNSSFFFSDKLSVGLLMNSSNYGFFKHMNVTLHSSFRLNEIIRLTASLSRGNKIGLGLSLKGGPFQFYILSDNFFDTFDMISNPYEVKNANLHFGTNFIF